MSLDLTVPLPFGSYAWCGECPWRSDAPFAHRDGKAHGERAGHVVHVWEAEEVCDHRYVTPLGIVYRCELHREHGESHHSTVEGGGMLTWPWAPVDKSVEAGG